MIIFPAIDLKDGKCVRLNQGDFNQIEVMETDPVKVAKEFEARGAEYIHMVDLDGALDGSMKNKDAIKKVLESIKIPLQVGGGIRSLERIDELLGLGVSRVILGTSALKDRKLLVAALKKYGEQIAVGVDAKNELVATGGWIDISDTNYIDFCKELEGLGVSTIIFTDISKDGMLQGPNIDQLSRLGQAVDVNIIASGGITTLDDVSELSKREFYGAIIGKAIYKGNIRLEEAIGI